MSSLRSGVFCLLALAMFAVPCAAQSSSFGNSVVIDGDEMLVGEPNSAFRPGLVYVYRKDGDGWTEVGQLEAPDAERADGFGAILALAGNTLFVAQRGGRIHAFEREGTEWRFSSVVSEGVIGGLDPGCNAYGYCGTDFGMALAAEGDWLLVGDPGVRAQPQRRRRRSDPDAPPPPSGAVYAFQRTADGSWAQRQRIESPESSSADAFGTALALVDGRALVGAPRASTQQSVMNAMEAEREGLPSVGAGRVFEFELDAGMWRPSGEITVALEDGAAFGAALVFEGDRAVVGAPGTGGSVGAVHLFERDPSTGAWSEAGELRVAGGEQGDRFGSAVDLDGDDVWVGAPVARGVETGMTFAYTDAFSGEEPARPLRIRFTEEETNTEDELGNRVVVEDGVAAVTAAGLDHGAGGVFVYERRGDLWRETGRLVSPPDALPAMVGEERRCTDGEVGVFDCENVELLAFVPISMLRAPGDNRGVRMNDNWGWTDPETGREYALAGRNDGTSFVDITDPTNPVLVGDLPKTPNTPRDQLWRDIKTYEDHAFIVADGAGEHGMQVFDLTRLRDVEDPPVVFEPDVLYRGEGPNEVASTHNVIINEETGFAYLTNRLCSGMHVVDIREPLSPKFVGCTDQGGTHDAQCLTYGGPDQEYRGREICLRMSGDRFQISDVTDKQAPRELARASHPNPAYMHQGWVTEDQRYFIMDDESDVIRGNVETTRTLIWDITDLEDPQLAEEFMGSMPASAHNLYVKGDFTYQANYRYGLHILDTSDPLNPREVGYFDTSPYQEGPGFSGAWSVYPFFESGSIIITSMQEGLHILKKRDRPIS